MQDFAGRTAVITGGADGIGKALAMAFAAQGMRVALLDIRADAAEETAAAMRASGTDARAFACDVTDSDSLTTAAAAVQAHYGSIALLAANAGVGAAGGLLSASEANLGWVLSVNIHGLIATARHFVPLFDSADAGPRHLLVSASSASLIPVIAPGLSLYAASKQCTLGIAEGLAAELAPQGISTTILCPGLINTRIWDGALARPDKFGGARHLPEEVGTRWRNDGRDADWVADCTVAAITARAPYCIPVEPHVAASFAERADAISASFTYPAAA
jgi:NAD(P)-dependent dehydrogenase (short-subunit alcohol dehydrogenase family)